MIKDQENSPRFSSSKQYPDTGESGDVYDCEEICARDQAREREWFVEDFMRLHHLKLFVLGKGRTLKAALAEWQDYVLVKQELGITVSL